MKEDSKTLTLFMRLKYQGRELLKVERVICSFDKTYFKLLCHALGKNCSNTNLNPTIGPF